MNTVNQTDAEKLLESVIDGSINNKIYIDSSEFQEIYIEYLESAKKMFLKKDKPKKKDKRKSTYYRQFSKTWER